MTPRLGLLPDLDAITNVMIRTMPLDPQWPYRFPWRHEYPEDHIKFTRMLVEYFLRLDYDDWLVMVSEDTDEDGQLVIVSFSIWEVSYRNKRRYGPSYKPQDPVTDVEKRGGSMRRDADHAHFDEFWQGQIKAYKRYFGPIGPDQIHLQILGTDPDYQRRGHASSLCRWGMDFIRAEKLKDISVMASPMGYELYMSLGFARVGTFYIQVPGEDERLTMEAMMYPPKI